MPLHECSILASMHINPESACGKLLSISLLQVIIGADSALMFFQLRRGGRPLIERNEGMLRQGASAFGFQMRN